MNCFSAPNSLPNWASYFQKCIKACLLSKSEIILLTCVFTSLCSLAMHLHSQHVLSRVFFTNRLHEPVQHAFPSPFSLVVNVCNNIDLYMYQYIHKHHKSYFTSPRQKSWFWICLRIEVFCSLITCFRRMMAHHPSTTSVELFLHQGQ